MHRDLLAVVLAFALAITSGLANPLTSQALQGDAVSGRIAPVEWTGEVVPGQGNVTLTADSLHDVYQQIIKINPQYNTDTNASIAAFPYDEYRCGGFATGYLGDLPGQIDWLYGLHGSVNLPKTKCIRYSCWATTAIYACNDNEAHGLQLQNSWIADYAQKVQMYCCGGNLASAGQVFDHKNNWNVVVGYGNCNHASDADRPGDFRGDPGDNGAC